MLAGRPAVEASARGQLPSAHPPRPPIPSRILRSPTVEARVAPGARAGLPGQVAPPASSWRLASAGLVAVEAAPEGRWAEARPPHKAATWPLRISPAPS